MIMTNPNQETKDQIQQSAVEIAKKPSPSSENNDGEVVFNKPYIFEGKEYASIDLSGIDDLTGDDLLKADQIYAGSGQYSPLPEMTLVYTFAIASNAAKLPLEFFNKLPAKEALKVKNRVVRFLNN